MKIKAKLKNLINKYKEDSLYKRLDNAKLTDLRYLSYDIPVLKTPEIYIHNDFYYHARNLKKFCGLNENYQLKCAIEHGFFYKNFHWECDTQNNNLPIILSMGDYRKDILNRVCNKKHYAIGPFIAYAEHYLTERQLTEEKKRLGKTLLVFPMHSTHWIDVKYDTQIFCDEITRIRDEYNFKTVRICMYWKDILNATHKIYQDRGFECVSAGHIYDKNFTPRLKSIISLSDVTMSNQLGTHIGYSIYMNKPHYIFIQESTEKNHEEEKIKIDTTDIFIDILETYFHRYSEIISPEQQDAAEKCFSFSKIKTKEELLEIFNEAEILYSKNRNNTGVTIC